MNLYEAFSAGRDRGQERRTRKTLSDYMQGALGGDKAAQTAIYQADPDAGYKVEQAALQRASDDREKAVASLQRAARMYSSAPAQIRPQMYGQIRSLTEQVGLVQPGTLPESLDAPEDQQGFEQFISAMAGGQKEEPRIVAPGSALVDNAGNLIYERPFAPKTFEGEDGVYNIYGDSARPVTVGDGGAGNGAMDYGSMDYGPQETDDYVRKIMTNVGQIDPNASPEAQAEAILPHLIRQESGGNPNAVSPKGARGLTQVMPATGRDPGFDVTPLRDNSPQENVRFGRDYLTAMLKRYPGRPDLALAAYNSGPGAADRLPRQTGGQLRSAPKQEARSDLERRIAAAKALGASDDEIKQLVLGRDAAAAGAKPMPAAALRMIQDETNAANTVSAINSSLQSHLSKIDSGKLPFGPVANLMNRGRNMAGMSTQESRNYQEFVSDLERLRNDSLRLNSGVQTDGDAQRAWNELFANINDKAYVKQRLQTILRLNQRAEQLRRVNIEMIRENYGQSGKPTGGQRQVKRTGKDKSGRRVVEYSDGSIEYAD